MMTQPLEDVEQALEKLMAEQDGLAIFTHYVLHI